MLSVAIAIIRAITLFNANTMLCFVECQEVITVIAIEQSVVQGPEIFWPGKLEGIQVRDILLDTGCSRTLVHKDLLSKDNLLAGEAVAIRCAHGDTVLYKLAQVQLEVERQAILMEVTVAVADKLPMSVLLGTDTPLLSKLLSGSYKRPDQCIKLIVLW